MKQIKRMKELVKILNSARDEYYNNSYSIMSDYEYDELFDELKKLENETGVIMTGSPTHTVGYEVKSKLDKIKHSHPMLSLDKTKSTDDLRAFAEDKNCVLSLKMDGLTVLLTYDNGELIQAETRGNGEEGELITHNAKVFENIPLRIDYNGRFEIEGETIITYDDFNKINSKLSEEDKYKTPRNLASGSVRQLDSNIAAQRHLRFIAWKIPFGLTTYTQGFEMAANLGFEVVPYVTYNKAADNIERKIVELKDIAEEKSFPIDGLVMTYDNVEYGKSLGMTGHHPRHSVAFKFSDDVYETTLREIEYSMGKTGTLTPVAIFNPVEIDGTEVSRASVHNISILTDLELSVGDTITVYKANQIIPQIAENLSAKERSKQAGIGQMEYVRIPATCPICGEPTEIRKDNDTLVLVCTNDDCQGKLLGKLSHAVSKNALNIDGMSEATLEFLISKGWVKSIKDLYHLQNVRDEWTKCEGFGKRSVDKLLENIEKSRKTTLSRLIYAQSIPLIGRSASKEIEKASNYKENSFCEIMENGNKTMFLSIDGFGDTMLKSLETWAKLHWNEFLELKNEFIFEEDTKNVNTSGRSLDGLIFVITGSLNHFENRDQLKELLESLGAKVSGSVSAKTFALICNENAGSSKSKKAASLGVPVWSEEQLLEYINS